MYYQSEKTGKSVKLNARIVVVYFPDWCNQFNIFMKDSYLFFEIKFSGAAWYSKR